MSIATNPSLPTVASLSGGGTSWSNIGNITSEGSGAQNVSYTKNNNHYSMVLQGTNIAWIDSHGNPFTFPNEATILGIQASFTGQKTGGTSALYGSYKLLGVPTIQRNDTYGLSPWDGSLTTVTWGNSTDLWGASKITPAQLNSPDFGWGFYQTNTQLPGSGIDFTLFYGTIKVWYAINAGLDQASVFNVWGQFGPATWTGGNPPSLVQVKSSFGNINGTFDSTPTPGNTIIGLITSMQGGSFPVVTIPAGTTPIGSGNTHTTGGNYITYALWSRAVVGGDGETWAITNSAGSLAYYLVELAGSVSSFQVLYDATPVVNGFDVDNFSKTFSLIGQSRILYSIFYPKSGDVSYMSFTSPAWLSYVGESGSVAVTTQLGSGVSPSLFAGNVDIQVYNEYTDSAAGGILLSCWN